jgi:AmmeMemoRadiSam system protein B
VAGRFYPAGPGALADLVDTLVEAVGEGRDEPLAEAYVVPHAGLRYSGATAARVYARLRRHRDAIDRVVLLGPAHFVRLRGCAVPGVPRWSSPLGESPVDEDGVRTLVKAGYALLDDEPHRPEHALEVQLPFLHRFLRPRTPILPVAVGLSTVDDVAAVLAAALAAGPARTVVLDSTDLSHYLDDAAARRQDARTIEAVLELAAERVGPSDACGVYGLRGLLGWARRVGLAAELLYACNSAEATGDPTRVVGYAAFAFSGTRPLSPRPGPAPPRHTR